jgi:S-formylglutathione hydrolase FrmB
MKTKIYALVLALVFGGFISSLHAQGLPFSSIRISIAPELRSTFTPGGRLFVHLSTTKEREPRYRAELSIAATATNWDASQPFILESKAKTTKYKGLDKWGPGKTYYYQVVYKQNPDDGQENVAGNIYSKVDSLVFSNKTKLNVAITELMIQEEVIQHPHVKTVIMKSELLSKFSGKDRFLKASILLPSGYFDNPNQSYPICYRVPGINGRYTTINGLMKDRSFTDFWFSKTAPQIIYVFLDSQGPYGDTYQVDSENNGPCGQALTEELIPAIEKLVHYNPVSKKRFVTGMSTGGWVALALQIFYPDFFDGTWSYSPDPIEFDHFGLINIYQDASIFYNRYGYLQPGRRTIYGEPTYSMKDWIASENFASRTDNYLISGGQFGAYNAVFSPKGKDGLPAMLFDPETGKIDHTIAKHWEKYDLLKVLQKNWPTLGPKLQGKLWIWTGDMDNLYSNVATRFFKAFLDKTENPRSDAQISFTAMGAHTEEWSDQAVLNMIGERVKAGK